MSSYNSFVPPPLHPSLCPRLPAPTSADLNEVFRNSGAPSLTTTSDRLLIEHNAHHNNAEIAAWDAFINERYPETGLTPAAALVPGPQLSTDDVTTAVMERPLERRLAPGPTEQETESRYSVPKLRKGLPRKGVSGQTIAKKVTQACSRCRKQKQKCDGEKPHCRRCTRKKQSCSYVPSQRQIELAQKKADENADPFVFEQPGPVESAPADNRYMKPPGRPLLPRPGAILGGLATGPTGHLQHSEQHGLTFGRLGFRSDGLSQHRQEPNLAFGGLDARPAGILQYTQQSNLTFGWYPRGLNGPSPFLEEPGYTFGGSVAQPSGISQYTRDPSMVYGGYLRLLRKIGRHRPAGEGDGGKFSDSPHFTTANNAHEPAVLLNTATSATNNAPSQTPNIALSNQYKERFGEVLIAWKAKPPNPERRRAAQQ
ncbi:MAG: hypothetical protein ALECFALPRED_004676 [Alectoria fallacina]|uniref:Zn(2)-C6 fungal-type domain-containing protein n=1 Tax=Alectoria fallacina TaxID=1903189 RepID=A0A8H3EQC3_9LECA|nr:MAG: hypothetical protein ALECFALPRED_004676 [Alectoria fallacina]